MHTQSLRGYHNTSLFPSPQVSLFDIPFLGAPKRWSVSSFTCWSRTWLGIGPGALPDLVAVPGELVCPANESGQGMAIRSQSTCLKENPEYHQVACLLIHLGAPAFWPGRAIIPAAQGASMVGISLKPPENVAETSTWETKHHTQRVGELRFIITAGPEELTPQALSSEQKGYRVFIHG